MIKHNFISWHMGILQKPDLTDPERWKENWPGRNSSSRLGWVTAGGPGVGTEDKGGRGGSRRRSSPGAPGAGCRTSCPTPQSSPCSWLHVPSLAKQVIQAWDQSQAELVSRLNFFHADFFQSWIWVVTFSSLKCPDQMCFCTNYFPVFYLRFLCFLVAKKPSRGASLWQF